MSKLIRAIVDTAPKRIGDMNQDALSVVRTMRMLDERYPEMTIEISSDGKQYLPLRDALKFDERIQRETDAAYQKGLNEGRSAGRSAGREEAQKAFSAFGKAIQDCTKQRASLLREAELHVTEMILKIAKKVTFNAAQIDPDVTAGIVKGAIDSLVDKRGISVRVNPEHLTVVQGLIEEFSTMSTDLKEFNLEGDASVAYGGCFIHTPAGDIDARLESQFAIIEESLRDE